MYRTLIAVALFSVMSSPLAAAGRSETHAEIAVPPGKMHALAFRELSKPACPAAAATNPSGNRLALGAPASACAQQTAQVQPAVAKAAH